MPRQNAYMLPVFTGCKREKYNLRRPGIEPGAYRVEGEGSTAEPATHMQTRHLPVSGDAIKALLGSVSG